MQKVTYFNDRLRRSRSSVAMDATTSHPGSRFLDRSSPRIPVAAWKSEISGDQSPTARKGTQSRQQLSCESSATRSIRIAARTCRSDDLYTSDPVLSRCCRLNR